MSSLINTPHARQHDGSGTIGRHIQKALAFAPRQHAEALVTAFENVILQRHQPPGPRHLREFGLPPHRAREPQLIVVITVFRQSRQITTSNSAERVSNTLAPSLGLMA